MRDGVHIQIGSPIPDRPFGIPPAPAGTIILVVSATAAVLYSPWHSRMHPVRGKGRSHLSGLLYEHQPHFCLSADTGRYKKEE